jgi:hypothetical protein
MDPKSNDLGPPRTDEPVSASASDNSVSEIAVLPLGLMQSELPLDLGRPTSCESTRLMRQNLISELRLLSPVVSACACAISRNAPALRDLRFGLGPLLTATPIGGLGMLSLLLLLGDDPAIGCKSGLLHIFCKIAASAGESTMLGSVARRR